MYKINKECVLNVVKANKHLKNGVFGDYNQYFLFTADKNIIYSLSGINVNKFFNPYILEYDKDYNFSMYIYIKFEKFKNENNELINYISEITKIDYSYYNYKISNYKDLYYGNTDIKNNNPIILKF